jgi:hypothetical protein
LLSWEEVFFWEEVSCVVGYQKKWQFQVPSAALVPAAATHLDV